MRLHRSCDNYPDTGGVLATIVGYAQGASERDTKDGVFVDLRKPEDEIVSNQFDGHAYCLRSLVVR